MVAERSSQCDLRDFVVRELLDLFGEAELIQQHHDRWIDAVAAEVAIEVLPRLQQGDRDSCASEEQSQHQAAGAASHHATGRVCDGSWGFHFDGYLHQIRHSQTREEILNSI